MDDERVNDQLLSSPFRSPPLSSHSTYVKMGAAGSKPDQETTAPGETTFYAARDSPVQVRPSSLRSLLPSSSLPSPLLQFSESLIDHLSSSASPSSGAPSAARQETLDTHIQSRINSELARLREQESSVRAEIEKALERENLDKEREGSLGGGHSVSLMKDLEELEERTKVAREASMKGKEGAVWAAVEGGRKALEQCFL